MTAREMMECALCLKHGKCAIEAAGGHTAILNSEERAKLAERYHEGMNQIATADMIAQGFVQTENGKWKKREEPLTANEQYLAIYDVANIVVNFAKWFEPIFTAAKERVENEYNSKHPITQNEVAN